MGIIDTEYDEAKVMRLFKKEAYEEGRAEEKKNTDRERRRADEAEQRVEALQNEISQLRNELQFLKHQLTRR